MQTLTKSLTVALAATLALAGARPAAAQAVFDRIAIGSGVSVFTFSEFVTADAGAGDGARLENAVGATVFLQHWLTPWAGARVDVSYARPRLTLRHQSPSVDTWMATLGLTLRPTGEPRPVAPYAMASAGIISYGLGGPSLRLPDTDLMLRSSETEQLLLQFGGGLDVALLTLRDGNIVGLRLEAANLVVGDRPFLQEEAADQGGHSHWRFTAGLSASIPNH